MTVNLANVGSSVGSRFNIVSALPTAVAVVVVGVFALSGAPLSEPSYRLASERLGDLGVLELAILALVVVALGVSLHPFQTRFVKALEGYWRPGVIGGLGLVIGRRRHRMRQQTLDRMRELDGARNRIERRYPELIDDRAQWAVESESIYPDDLARIMPTRLGNALRSAEDRAGLRYGLDAVELIPHLMSVMPPAEMDAIGDVRDQLDVAARFTWTWLFIAVASSTVLLSASFVWAIVPLAAYGLAWLSYQGAVISAVEYGETLIRTVDLYRFDLLTKMRMPLPADLQEERETNKLVMDLITLPPGDWEGREKTIWYVHPD